ncbi:nucleotidyltransferase family protein [Vibrio sagamiensis]|uniref:Xanthine dehydrogenase n=1 Tax=Vibrio sagamiensis NBRC 104589 TaxID=1219064 RepID=A0A511QCE2_9VIBR|nr:nucleotidyltransferase family protein [Vibrio sagamiensis]PNQ56119.1 nucleotidyltransferase family protein [Vibrio agarivorans]GEM74969.1 xanthine dehydrogenase [Vibrio sagamiensis NBRC 104589]
MVNSEKKIALMIMAAGESKRFGSCKQLTSINKEHTLLSHAAEQALSAQIGPVFIITGRWHNEIEQAQQHGILGATTLLYYPNWSNGLGSSIAYGTKILALKYDAILITLADQIALADTDYQVFADYVDSEHIVCSNYSGKRGVPALFPACYFSQLAQLSGEHGARSLLREEQYPLLEVRLPHAEYDIDTPEALDRWKKDSRILSPPLK